MKLAFCGCRACRRGRHRHGNQKIIRNRIHAGRKQAKLMLRQGRFDEIPERISVSYTD